MNSIDYLEQLNWRYATKKFDADKKLADTDLDKLLDAIQLSASSYGMQPYKIDVVSDFEVRKKLHPAAFEQSQILDASCVLVFSAITKIDEAFLDEYINSIAETRNMKVDELSGLKEMIMDTVVCLPNNVKTEWAKRQAYLALGNLLSAAAYYKIDACPMEGFNPSQFEEILGLTEKNREATVIVCLGYRHKEDGLQHAKKVRKSKSELFTRI